jgi:hypothetical protein
MTSLKHFALSASTMMRCALRRAAELYRPLAETPTFVRKLIISLELRAKDLRALGRGEDAAGADAEVAKLQSMAAD